MDTRKSVTKEMDMDVIATIKPVHSAQVSDDPGFSKPAMPENIAWSTI